MGLTTRLPFLFRILYSGVIDGAEACTKHFFGFGYLAQGRTETFYNVLPSYALFHVTWRLNKKPKSEENEKIR